ncbi:predicted protein [Aspergillus terreus NIH2624]|uniref:Uncharacterized protein n=1 Tax=Aspergillus terreus (strain NIH 2624 / FGSC A1156) TaxID=341663 RepID=Q0CYB0_ASPTN|nr:uncharacterized protein ATEG_01324 [Aspergillus terreus NIH2624]EAU38081.1 predicted protein [Aspergillus terreus NIH2624]
MGLTCAHHPQELNETCKYVTHSLICPGPPPRRASSIPWWVAEGSRSLASRASNRASVAFRRKSAAPAPLRISAPSDFRRVPTFSLQPDDSAFRPLELSFNTPKNPLPDLLHIFDDIQLNDERQRQGILGLNRPPRALSSPADVNPLRFSRPGSHHPSSSFQLPRKPVGSGSRRSSLATLEQLLDRQSIPIASPLIPHFSLRSSAVTGLTASVISPLPSRLDFPGAGGADIAVNQQRPATATTTTTSSRVPHTPHLPDRPIPTDDQPIPPQSHHPPTTPLDTRPPTTTSSESTLQRTPPRAGRVTQWLFQTSPKPFALSSWKPPQAAHLVNPFRVRSRTLSGSTAVSSQTSMTAATTVAGPPVRTSTSSSFAPGSSALAKELELTPSVSFSRPLPSSAHPSDERTYPTIYEGQPQKHHEYEDLALSHYGNYRHSAVGVAF